jgi:hypothetical protein
MVRASSGTGAGWRGCNFENAIIGLLVLAGNSGPNVALEAARPGVWGVSLID